MPRELLGSGMINDQLTYFLDMDALMNSFRLMFDRGGGGINLIQFVTFRIGRQLLGIDLLRVREVRQVNHITPVQHARPYIRGLVNLRGQTFLIFDLGVAIGAEARCLNG